MGSSDIVDFARLSLAYERVRDELLAERTPDGHWVGELSSSALSTATAISALSIVGGNDELVSRGITWLVKQQNSDGGFGDTDLSHSNIATTYLVVAALNLAGVADVHAERIARANAYIDSKGRFQGLRDRYGIDKTFVVPIMTNLALAGLVDWREIDPLPFELACVPQSWYRFVGMPVVSYAIPALVAIGQARFFHSPPRNPICRLIRQLSISRSLNVLRRMQPDSGGYLEATPLTSFVVMSLAGIRLTRPSTAGNAADTVISEGVKFLIDSARPDGSWPIDTNLATWNTTLSINALAGAGENVAELLGPQCLNWLLSCQHTKPHPFTGAHPGGFGWSDLSGAVPDADDTPGAIIALCSTQQEWHAWGRARNWLRELQNSDGGWPTFCRGWGRLPFDRSGADLTAHALRAFRSLGELPSSGRDKANDEYFRRLYGDCLRRGLSFLSQRQAHDGSWSPLWFGNQDHAGEENLVYGTAKVLMAYRDLGLMDLPEAQRGIAWLIANQNSDGGWGSGVWDCQNSIPNPKSQIPNLKSSVEETALAVEALLAACKRNATEGVPYSAVAKGLNWLMDCVESGHQRQPAPIGFYFAKLWYYERLYPLIFTVAALGRACRQLARPAENTSPAATSEFRAS